MVLPTLWRSSSLPAWDDVFSMRRDVDRLLDRFFSSTAQGTQATWSPTVDIRESGDEIMILAELPGLDPQDVQVTVEEGVLTISGEKREERQEGEDGGNYHLIERRYGRFERYGRRGICASVRGGADCALLAASSQVSSLARGRPPAFGWGPHSARFSSHKPLGSAQHELAAAALQSASASKRSGACWHVGC